MSFPKSSNVALIPNASGYFPGAGTMPTTNIGTLEFSQFNFSNLAIADISSTTLANYDTAVLLQVGNIQSVLSPTQKADINAWINNGGKLIIYDSDACNQQSGLPDYSWLPYPFTTNNPGQLGSNSGTFTIVENNTLSSTDPASPYYIDTTEVTTNTDAVGDANIMITQDPHWHGDMQATNANGVTGWCHAYAAFGSGLIIYDGLDTDYIGSDINLQKIWYFELLQPWNPDGLPRLFPVKIAVYIQNFITDVNNKIAVETTLINIMQTSTVRSLNATASNPAATNAVNEIVTNEKNLIQELSNTLQNIINGELIQLTRVIQFDP